MATIKFFYQERYDGGVRTGIGVNDEMVLHRFLPGDEDSDPALLWYLDVVFKGDSLPAGSDEAKQWLCDQSDTIKRELLQAAEHLVVGLDVGPDTRYRATLVLMDSATGEIMISGARSLSERELADKVRSVAASWDEIMTTLAPFVEA